jgi:uncharacterized protein YggU (UPF0235/DUF167 family)
MARQKAKASSEAVTSTHAASSRIVVRVKPRASRNAVEGVKEGVWQVAVSAAPADNAANQAVVQVLARALKRPRSALSLVRGHKSRDKVLLCEGLAPDDVAELLASASASAST